MYQSFLNEDFVVRHSSRKGSTVPMNQALEKAYNKPAKSSAVIAGFIRRKEAVCKRNLIKHEKAKYRNFMDTVCQMDEDDKYSMIFRLDYQSKQTYRRSPDKNVHQRGNPFNLEQPKSIMSIATGAILEKDEEDFLMNWLNEKASRNELYESRLSDREKHTVAGSYS